MTSKMLEMTDALKLKVEGLRPNLDLRIKPEINNILDLIHSLEDEIKENAQ